MFVNSTKIFCKIFNGCLEEGIFPPIWKIAKLLIQKPKKNPNATVTYRPIGLLNVIGKVMEALIKRRLEIEMDEKQLLHEEQHGFRPGRSTIDALMSVKNISDSIKNKSYRHRPVCLMITIDIENAFNSTPWTGISEALKTMKFSRYLIRIVQSYLSDRFLVSNYEEWTPIHCGVPQGSVLRPTLWNIFYDGVLSTELETGTKVIAYADDLAILVWTKNIDDLQEKAENALSKISGKLSSLGLKIAAEKTEMVLLEGRRKINNMELSIASTTIKSRKALKYLGVHISSQKWADRVRRREKSLRRRSRPLPSMEPIRGTGR